MTCQESKNLFVEAYYSELDADTRISFTDHLAGCTACSSAYQEMVRTLELMNRREEIAPSKEFMTGFWDNLDARLDAATGTPVKSGNGKPSTRIFTLLPSWSYGIAAMILIGLGILLGRVFFSPDMGTSGGSSRAGNMQGQPDSAFASREEIDREVQNYLDRSRTLLLGVVNSPDESGNASSVAPIERQQRISRELIQKAAFLKSELNEPDDAAIKKLIGDLQVVLMQLANYSVENGVPLVELVKQGVDKKSILLKINLEQLRALGAGSKSQSATKQPNRKSRT